MEEVDDEDDEDDEDDDDEDDEDDEGDEDDGDDDETAGHTITLSVEQLQQMVQNGTLESVLRNAAAGGAVAGSGSEHVEADSNGGASGRRGSRGG